MEQQNRDEHEIHPASAKLMSEPPKGGGRPKISVCGIVKRNKPRKISPPGSAVCFCDAEHEALEHTAR